MNNNGNLNRIISKIENEDIYRTSSGFSADKEAIMRLFKLTKEESREDIFLRLTVIDSMYSTQMSRRYYGLDELADALYELKTKTKDLKQLFLKFLDSRDEHLFDYVKEEKGEKSQTNLLNEGFGIGKDGDPKGIAISLISKYAYFDTELKFPIYDSIACEMLPVLWKYCEMKGRCSALSGNGRCGVERMKTFLEALDLFKKNLGIEITYDYLDRILWFVGKIRRGNLSLVLSRKEYDTLLQPSKFNISDIKLSDLKFLKKGTLLYDFFELAQHVGPKVVKHRKIKESSIER